ncbi:hypothetical protein [Pantoea stewartii]|uniref:hypothetical protein n=1 Tax=Pantoea stewartii TaxID=66269 RepID=UPI0006D00FDA|nr:hypothetical protein [Pantoea stewartii]
MEALFPLLVGKPLATFILTALWSAACFFCGAYIGHRFSLGRDTRKEFNLIADVVRDKIRNHLRIIERGEIPNYHGNITVTEYDTLMDVTKKSRRNALSKAWANYQQAQEDCGNRDDNGFYVFHSPEILKKALEDIIPFVKRQ